MKTEPAVTALEAEAAGETAGRITALVPDPRMPEAVRVAVGGRLLWTIAAETVIEARLRPGTPVTPELRERLESAADAHAAWRAVLAALGRRAYATRDLGRRLAQRGHPRPALDYALARAAGAGLLDDAAFARHYAEAKAARGRGPARLLRDLLLMGVERAVAEQAIREEWEERGEGQAMPRRLAERRAAQLGSLPLETRRRRLKAYLARRGFTGPAINGMVREVLSGPESQS